MLDARLAMVDLETTGITATGNRITEIGIVLVENGAVIEEWHSLANPECAIPVEIQALTGNSTPTSIKCCGNIYRDRINQM